jgi:hypothetical protein
MLADRKRAEEVRALLNELLALLREQNEMNWSRGIRAATQELLGPGGVTNEDGLDNARSIYNTMVAGGRGFSEYSVWSENEDERIDANKRIDDLRCRIWNTFNS